MTEDIQENTPSQEGEVSQEAEKSQEQSLTQEQVKQMVAEAVAQAQEAAKREIQSAKDRATAEIAKAQRRAQEDAGLMDVYNREISGLDTETQQRIKLAGYEAREKAERQRMMETDTQERNQGAYEQWDKGFHQEMAKFAAEHGIEATDKRIDWAEDLNAGVETNYLGKIDRILASVSKILKENAKTEADKATKEEKARIHKEYGLDSLDKTTSLGVSGSDEEFLAAYGRGESDDHKRAKQIMDKLEKGG